MSSVREVMERGANRTIPLAALLLALFAPLGMSQPLPGDLDSGLVLGPDAGGFGGELNDGDLFGAATTSLGDINGDGVPDLALGAPGSDHGGTDRGALWLLFMASDGTVASQSLVGSDAGGFGGALADHSRFGQALASPGDIDGDGVVDLVVGAPRDPDGGSKRGAVWVLFLDAGGGVRAEQKISDLAGGFTGKLRDGDEFGRALSAAGDVDGDGVPDLAVSTLSDRKGGTRAGAIWILFLNADGSVREHRLINGTQGGFDGELNDNDTFGSALALLGDLDGNGVADLAVGALNDDDGGTDRGALWILLLSADGMVIDEHKISSTSGGFAGPLADADGFGRGIAAVGDVDGNGTPDLLVGAPGDDVVGSDRGAVWLLLLAADGGVLSERRYDELTEPVIPGLSDGDASGLALSVAGDLDGNGAVDWVLGAPRAGDDRGEARVLLLAAEGSEPFVPSASIFDGRPGRAILVLPDPEGAGSSDFIDEPVIITSNTSGHGVNVRVGQSGKTGDFSFKSEQDIPTGQHPLGIGSGNFSAGTGLIAALEDVVVANRGSDDFSFLLGLPDGSFAPAVNHSLLPENAAPMAVSVADYDLDGELDVALAGNAGISVFLGVGHGVFMPPVFTPLALLTDIQSGLIDDDEFPDLICTSGRAVTPALPSEEGFATVLTGNGDGTFRISSTFASGTALASALLSDVNADGALDALLVSHAFDSGPDGQPQGRIDLYAGDGLGSFSLSPAFSGYQSTSGQGIHPLYGALGDLDGDGTLDAVYSSGDNIAHEPGTFADEQPPVSLTVLRGLGGGAFEPIVVGTAYAGKGVDPILADIFADPQGLPDAILVWYEDTAAGLEGEDEQLVTFVTAFTSDGEAGFFDPSSSQFDVGGAPSDATIADVNSDDSGSDHAPQGRLDVLVSNMADNSLSILLGNGDGGVRSELMIPDVGPYTLDDLPAGDWVGGLRCVRVADLSSDGLPDALVCGWFVDQSDVAPDPRVFASLSRMDGAQAALVQSLRLDRAGEMELGDLSGDTRPDVVLAARVGPGGPDALHIFDALHDGSLPFAPRVLPIPAGLSLSGGLVLADVSGDGRLDVLTTAVDTEADEGLLLIVDGVSSESVTVALGPAWGEVASVVLGDLTGDGLADVAVGLADGRLFVARGLGGSRFEAFAVDAQAAAVGGGALALADVDGDQRLDLVSSTATDDGNIDQAFVRVLLGTASEGIFSIQNVDALQATGPLGATAPRIADMNGDGALDLVLVHGTSNRVSILVNQLSSFESYGGGKPGSRGLVPQLSAQGFSTPGGHFELHLSDGLGGASGVLQVGSGRVESGFLHVQSVLFELPIALDGLPGEVGAGSGSWDLATPDDSELVGLEVSFQVLLHDPGAGPPAPTQLAASPGLAMLIVK
ncbi:MAG: hypothetical protein DRQ55_04260 [Planctomycetota bacterium]|nr:MAG: hypothetical protein DRQ55_04260 [Planctomycetota bacterium]